MGEQLRASESALNLAPKVQLTSTASLVDPLSPVASQLHAVAVWREVCVPTAHWTVGQLWEQTKQDNLTTSFLETEN